MSANYNGDAEKVVSSKYLYDTLKDFKGIADSNYADKTKEHEHTNKSVLDKFSTDTNGDLTYDGNPVNSDSTAIGAHINDTSIHVDATFKSDTTTHIADSSIHMSSDEKKTLNSAYQKPITGIPKTDLESSLQTEIDNKADTSAIIDSAVSQIKADLMNSSGIDHTLIKNIGTMSHDELEQVLDNHISNTIIHQTQTLGQLIVTGADFNAGTFINCNYNASTGYVELNKAVTTDPVEYVTDEATYISSVLNTGVIDCSYVTFSWLGKYNSDYTNITAYIRYGAVSSVDSTWTAWEEVPYNKTISGTAQYCQAKIVFKTSDKFKNIILKNIIIYYGVDMGTELVEARTDVEGTTFPMLKMRLNNMETKVANSKALGLVQPDDKTSTDTVYTVPVKVDSDGKLYAPFTLQDKALGEELTYCYYQAFGISQSAGTSILTFSTEVENNGISIDSANQKFELKANRTYEINFAMFAMFNSSGKYLDISIVDYTNSKTLTNGHLFSGGSYLWSSSPAYNAIVSPTTDILVGVQSYIPSGNSITNGQYTISIKEIGRQIVTDPLEHVNTQDGLEDTPVGHLISYVGSVAPKHYLICDGSEYNIPDYPDLAKHFLNEFGSESYFGGDGTLTFNVPKYEIQYNNIIVSPYTPSASSVYDNNYLPIRAFDDNVSTRYCSAGESTSSIVWLKVDLGMFKQATYAILGFGENATKFLPSKVIIQGSIDDTNWEDIYTLESIKYSNTMYKLGNKKAYRYYRLYMNGSSSGFVYVHTFKLLQEGECKCIKAEPTYFMKVEGKDVYSTDETLIGTWLGKPLYRKVFKDVAVNTGKSWQTTLDLTDLNAEYVSVGNDSQFYLISDPTTMMSAVNISTYMTVGYKDKNLITYKNNTLYDYIFKYLVLEYTKTTDT